MNENDNRGITAIARFGMGFNKSIHIQDSRPRRTRKSISIGIKSDDNSDEPDYNSALKRKIVRANI